MLGRTPSSAQSPSPSPWLRGRPQKPNTAAALSARQANLRCGRAARVLCGRPLGARPLGASALLGSARVLPRLARAPLASFCWPVSAAGAGEGQGGAPAALNHPRTDAGACRAGDPAGPRNPPAGSGRSSGQGRQATRLSEAHCQGHRPSATPLPNPQLPCLCQLWPPLILVPALWCLSRAPTTAPKGLGR